VRAISFLALSGLACFSNAAGAALGVIGDALVGGAPSGSNQTARRRPNANRITM